LKNRQRKCYALRSSLFSCNKQQKTIPTYLDVIFFFYYTYIGRQKALDIVVFLLVAAGAWHELKIKS